MGVALVVAVVALYLLVRWWARRANVDDDDPLEVRFIDRPTGDPERARRHWLRRLGWTGTPTDAAAAYRQLLREIDHREVVARQPSETPREHARRLREVDVGGLPLELLAADHALAAFGGVRLSQHEERRALARWRTLRRTLRAPSPPPELPER